MDPQPDAPHDWIVATEVPIEPRLVRRALASKWLTVPPGTRVVVMDIYCRACRRVQEDVAGEPCSALINNEHLRGGPIGERKKRRKLPTVEHAAG